MRSREYPLCGHRVIRARLANGLTVLIVPKPGTYRKFAGFAVHYGGTDIRFRLGGESTETPAGIAHFLEHTLFEMPEARQSFTTSLCKLLRVLQPSPTCTLLSFQDY